MDVGLRPFFLPCLLLASIYIIKFVFSAPLGPIPVLLLNTIHFIARLHQIG